MAPLLEARAISRRFGHVRALDGADFAVHAGEICALIGDNGAGKSTLVKILSGADRPDEGQILIAGKLVAFNSPNDAQAHGIATVYQDLALAADLRPFENLFLGREIILPGVLGRLGFFNRTAMRRQAGEQFERLGVRLRSARAPVSSCRRAASVGRDRAPRCERAASSSWTSPGRLRLVQTGRVLDAVRQVRDRHRRRSHRSICPRCSLSQTSGFSSRTTRGAVLGAGRHVDRRGGDDQQVGRERVT